MRTRDGKALVRHYLSEWGHDYRSIQSWREQHGATERPGLYEFFAAHGICADCAGAGIDIVDEESLSDRGAVRDDGPLYDVCQTCGGTGKAERSEWTRRPRQIFFWSPSGLLAYHPLESHGHSIQAIKEWRSVSHDDGRKRSLRDFYVAHGLCSECRGEGVLMAGKRELSPEEKAERPWLDPEDEYPIYQSCSSCQGAGKAAIH